MKDIYHITPEEVAERALMPYRLVETEEKMYEEMGRIMADRIEKITVNRRSSSCRSVRSDSTNISRRR